MNRIVRKHYPASKLPDDVRGDIDASALVTLAVEVEEAPRKRLTLDDLTSMIDKARAGKRPVSEREAVARIRKLRNEWED